MHHLIINYFKRKINHQAGQIVQDYEKKQNFNASSYDFCVKNGHNYKCDYVQWHGTSVASVTVRKSINLLNKVHETSGSKQIYTKYSVEMNMFDLRVSPCHLIVTQSLDASSQLNKLDIKLVTHRGLIVPLANFDVGAWQAGSMSTPQALLQHTFTTPLLVVWKQSNALLDQWVTMQINGHIQVAIVNQTVAELGHHICEECDRISAMTNFDTNKWPVAQIKLSLVNGGDSIASTLDSVHANVRTQSMFDLCYFRSRSLTQFVHKLFLFSFADKFTYISYQPIEFLKFNRQHDNNKSEETVSKRSTSNKRYGNFYKYLGNEQFYNQIELHHVSSTKLNNFGYAQPFKVSHGQTNNVCLNGPCSSLQPRMHLHF